MTVSLTDLTLEANKKMFKDVLVSVSFILRTQMAYSASLYSNSRSSNDSVQF